MTNEPIRGRRWNKRLAALVLAAVGTGLTTQHIIPLPVLAAQQPVTLLPPAQPTPPALAQSQDTSRAVAYIYGNVAVTHEEFGKFLMDRGGSDKLELFVNKRIIEEEAKKAGATVSKEEMELALIDDLVGIGVKKEEFLQIVLPKYGKSLFEWMEDVIRPRLLISKMCRKRMEITDADLKLQFERRYGEQRRVQMIMWPKKDDLKSIHAAYAELRKGQTEFDQFARAQANPALASAKGHIKPITKHLTGEDKIVETTAFSMRAGDVSEILNTHQGWIVMKLHEIVPPRTDVTFEKEKTMLEKAAFEEKLTNEIPKLFAEMKERAKPNLLYTGPTDWKTISRPLPALPPVQQATGTVIQPPMQITPR